MKTIHSITIILLLFVIFSCQKESVPKPLPELGYPTTYKPLNSIDWEVRNAAFQQIKIHEGLSLNEYGFVEGIIKIDSIDTITKELISEKIDSTLNLYHEFMGIVPEKTFNIDLEVTVDASFYITPGGRRSLGRYFEDIEKMREDGYLSVSDEEKLSLKFFLTQNRIEDKYLSGYEIVFDFESEKNSIKISGNWIPKVLVPEEKIYNEDDALGIAYREILKRTGRNIWESKENYNTYSLLLKVKNGDQFEIRDCWCINTVEPPYNGYTIAIYIDTQTGEVVKYYDKL